MPSAHCSERKCPPGLLPTCHSVYYLPVLEPSINTMAKGSYENSAGRDFKRWF